MIDTRSREISRTCVHEMGHAIAAVLFGAKLERVTLTVAGGMIRADAAYVAASPHVRLAVALAGVVAERVALGSRELAGAEGDLDLAIATAEQLWGAAAAPYGIERVTHDVYDLLLPYASTIRALGLELHRRRELTGADVAAAIARVAGRVA